ncbi:hypothetical protein HPB50_003368 [Hyalomma asiaticum]|uniref:Uncharacterized protein n=1 Tax=Hyalomma asiaticum TaxID=266040 RepID=A0ACB7TI15_HYAAI|nr:hypothetical protein HPB50_003368 [Hyalomma asiaticum]
MRPLRFSPADEPTRRWFQWGGYRSKTAKVVGSRKKGRCEEPRDTQKTSRAPSDREYANRFFGGGGREVSRSLEREDAGRGGRCLLLDPCCLAAAPEARAGQASERAAHKAPFSLTCWSRTGGTDTHTKLPVAFRSPVASFVAPTSLPAHCGHACAIAWLGARRALPPPRRLDASRDVLPLPLEATRPRWRTPASSPADSSLTQWRRRHLRAADTHIRAAWRAPPPPSSSWTDAARSSRSGAGAAIGPFVTEQTFSGQTRRIAACIRLRSQTHYEGSLHGALPPSLFARLSFFVSGSSGSSNRIRAPHRRELATPLVARQAGLRLRGYFLTARLLRRTAAEEEYRVSIGSWATDKIRDLWCEEVSTFCKDSLLTALRRQPLALVNVLRRRAGSFRNTTIACAPPPTAQSSSCFGL